MIKPNRRRDILSALKPEVYGQVLFDAISTLDVEGMMTIILSIAKTGQMPSIENIEHKEGIDEFLCFKDIKVRNNIRPNSWIMYNYTKGLFEANLGEEEYKYQKNDISEVIFVNKFLHKYADTKARYVEAFEALIMELGFKDSYMKDPLELIGIKHMSEWSIPVSYTHLTLPTKA